MTTNAEKYDRIKEWIIKQIAIPKCRLSIDNLLFVAGNTGIGKTHNILEICSSLNLDILQITTNNCMSSDELVDVITKNITSNMIQILSNNFRKKIIIIDEFESMMAIDRTINTALLNILTNSKLNNIPIICISSLEIVKKIGSIKKKCEIIEIDNPSNKEVLCILKNLYEKSEDIKTIERVAQESNGNISHCIQKIQNKIYNSMDENVNINILYGNEFKRDIIKKIINIDPWLIPLRFHENLISEIGRRKCVKNMSYQYYKEFMKNFIYFDNMMNISVDFASDYFASISYFLYTLPLKKNTKSNIDNFTKILSYLSLQKKYIKKSYTSNTSLFPLYQIGNYHINNSGRNFMFFN